MQYRLLPAFLIFIGSYLPLAIILAVQDIPKTWWAQPICTIGKTRLSECVFNPFNNPSLSIAFLIITSVSIVLGTMCFRKISYPFDIEVTAVKETPNDLINYVFPYVVSFMGISYTEREKLLGFGIFLLWMFAITYKSGQILMNPLLIIFGWRLHEANVCIGNATRTVRVLKKGLLVPGPHKAQTIQDFYIAKD